MRSPDRGNRPDDLFPMAMSAAMPGIAILDADGRLLAWNAAFEREFADAAQRPRRGLHLAAMEGEGPASMAAPAAGIHARTLLRGGTCHVIEELALPMGGTLRTSKALRQNTAGVAPEAGRAAEFRAAGDDSAPDDGLLGRLSAAERRDLAEDVADLIAAEGTSAPQSAPFDIVDLVEGAAAQVAARAGGKGLRLAAFVAPELRTGALGDARCLGRILCRLAGIAVTFTDAGSVTVEAVPAAAPQPRNVPPGRCRIRFQVVDTGTGIPESGTDGLSAGLALAVCDLLASRAGARIGLDRRPEGGSLAWLEIDLPVRSASRDGQMSDSDARVLLVDIAGQAHADLLRHLQALDVPVGQVADMRLAARELAEARAIGLPYRMMVVGARQAARAAAHGAALSAVLRAAVPGETRLVLLGDGVTQPAASRPDWVDAVLPRPIFLQPLLDCLQPADDSFWNTAAACHAAPAAAPRPAPAGMPERGEADPPLRILLVEDNPMSLRVMQAFLSRPGFCTDVVTEGAAAVTAVAGRAYDVVLLDLRMPGCDGFEVARRIRALDGPQRHVHIIAVTADVTSQVQRRCRAVGMDDYLAKPVQLSLLEEKLQALPRTAVPAPAQAISAWSGAGRSRSPESR